MSNMNDEIATAYSIIAMCLIVFVIVLIIPFVVNASSELPKLYFYGNVKNMEEKIIYDDLAEEDDE